MSNSTEDKDKKECLIISWKDLTHGALIRDLKRIRENKTGAWRSLRPIWNKEKCINCYRCWMFCPEAAIIVENEKVVGIDYDYCKGCGICAKECPEKVKAITMEREKK